MSSTQASNSSSQLPARFELETRTERCFELSPTLAINQQIALERARGRHIVHLGFGEARLPVVGTLVRTLREAAHENSYGPVRGAAETRRLAAGWMERRGVETLAEQVAVTPGSKAGLYGLLATLPGDLVLPRPSWVSYAAQARLLGKRILWCDIPDVSGGVPDPDVLPDALESAYRAGLEPGIVMLTVPDNPTGTVADAETLRRVLEICEEHDLAVIADEIYRDLAYEPQQVPAAAQMAPDRTYVTTGLSKALSLGGWRIGVVRAPANTRGAETMRRLEALGSEVWSCVPVPIEGAAAAAFEEPPSVRDYIRSARTVHKLLARTVHEIVVDLGCECRPPAGAFYLYPTFSGLVDAADDVQLQCDLLEGSGVATLPGSAFGDVPSRLRLRLATTFLCGDTLEEQQETLAAADDERVLALPRVAAQLEDLKVRLGRRIS